MKTSYFTFLFIFFINLTTLCAQQVTHDPPVFNGLTAEQRAVVDELTALPPAETPPPSVCIQIIHACGVPEPVAEEIVVAILETKGPERN